MERKGGRTLGHDVAGREEAYKGDEKLGSADVREAAGGRKCVHPTWLQKQLFA